jgi:hypothetical protein
MPEKPPINNLEDELARLWQDQKLDGNKMALEAIRKKNRNFERAIRNRNLREYVAAVLVVVGFGATIFHAENNYVRLGSVLVIAAAVYVVYALHTRGSSQQLPGDTARMTLIQFHRSSLERQRDLLRDIWRWYILPFVPGLLLNMFGSAVRDGAILNPQRTPEQARHGLNILVFTLFMFGFFFLVAALNKRTARKLQRKINELDAEETTE